MAPDLRDHIQSMLGSGYRLSKELGGAGMSRVFIADDEALGQRVVVKVLPPELAAGVNVERFKREIQLAAQLHHPNVVPVLSAGQTSEMLWYSMPLIQGETLRALLEREHQLPLDAALGFARDVAAALTYAHEQNIVHRDIKPENILIENGRALVADFGIARAIEKSVTMQSVTSTGLTLGTPTYMSPEQAAAEKRIDGRSDIYSLGCVVYEMLAGEPPFTGPSARSVIAKHINERPPSVLTTRPNLPPHVQKALYIALAKAPADRFATAQEFAEALATPDVTAERPLPLWPRRSRWRTAAVAAAVLAPAAVAGVLWSRAPSQAPATASARRVAVLYFDAPPADTQLTAIAHGLTRELISALRTQDLAIISEPGVSRFAPRAAPDSVAAALHVGTIVYGRVDRIGHGDSILVDARLVDSAAVERAEVLVPAKVREPLELLHSVVADVAAELRMRLGREIQLARWKASASSPRAWELRQRAAELNASAPEAWQRGAVALAQAQYAAADSLLAVAEKLDPRWIDLVVERGWTAWARASISASTAKASLVDTALAFANRALAAQPGNAAALELRGFLRFQKYQFVLGRRVVALRDSAEADLREATIADPSRARAWNTYSALLQEKGNLAAATDAARRAIAADPYQRDVPQSVSRLFFAYLFAAQYDSADALCREFLPRFPTDPRLRQCELSVIGWSRSGDSAIRRAWALAGTSGLSTRDPGEAEQWASTRLLVGATIARSHLTDSARDVIANTRSALAAAGQPRGALVNEAYVWTLLGARDTAVALLREFVAEMPAQRTRLAGHPWFTSLRSDPRFVALTTPATTR